MNEVMQNKIVHTVRHIVLINSVTMFNKQTFMIRSDHSTALRFPPGSGEWLLLYV
jgi:hypothetical protein